MIYYLLKTDLEKAIYNNPSEAVKLLNQFSIVNNNNQLFKALTLAIILDKVEIFQQIHPKLLRVTNDQNQTLNHFIASIKSNRGNILKTINKR